MSGRIILARHGETDLNTEGHLRGWLDIPLNDRGWKDAYATVDAICTGYTVDHVVCTDLRRGAVMGALLEMRLGIKVEYTTGLRPWNVGAFAGQPVREVMLDMAKYAADPDLRIPGGESWNEFLARAMSVLDSALAESQRDNETIVLITHTRNVRVYLGRLWLAAIDDPVATSGLVVFDGNAVAIREHAVA